MPFSNHPESSDQAIKTFTRTNHHYYSYKWKTARGLGQWNWAATLTGPIWFAYRKQYTTAVFLILLLLWFDFSVSANPFHLSLPVELFLLSGLIANNRYYRSFRRYLKKPRTLLTGTSWKAPVISGLIYIILLTALPLFAGLNLYSTSIKKVEFHSFFYTLSHPEIKDREIHYLRQDYQKAFYTGQFDKSLLLNKNTLKLAHMRSGFQNNFGAAIQSELISYTLKAGRYKEAEQLTQDLLRQFELQFGKDHLFTTFIINNLAANYIYQGKFNQAKPHSYNCLIIMEHYPKDLDHPVILSQQASIFSNMAVIQQAMCHYQEALQLHQEALQLSLKANNGYSLASYDYLIRLGDFYKERLELKQAAKYYHDARKLISRYLPAPNPLMPHLYNRLGELSFLNGRYDQALNWLSEAGKINRLIFRDNHTVAAQSHYLLGKVLFSKGKLAQAEKQLETAISVINHTIGQENSLYADYSATLADFHQFRNNHVKAFGLLTTSLTIYEKIYGYDSPRLVFVLEQLSHTAEELNNPKAALDYLRRAQQIKARSSNQPVPDPKNYRLDREGIVI